MKIMLSTMYGTSKLNTIKMYGRKPKKVNKEKEKQKENLNYLFEKFVKYD